MRLAAYDIDSLDNRDPALIDRLARFVEATIEPYHRAEVRGLERVPAGGALYVGNHNGFIYTPDTWLLGAALYRALGVAAVPYGLGHDLVLNHPVTNRILCPLGAVRACHDNGERLLEAGKKVIVYPGGDLDAMRPYRHRNRVVFGGRCGFVRLALRTGAPIVPVVAAGAHETFIILDDMRWLARLIGAERKLRIGVWPLTLSIPWGLSVGPPLPWVPFPSKIIIEVLEPIELGCRPEHAKDRTLVAHYAEQVRAVLGAALTRLAEERADQRSSAGG